MAALARVFAALLPRIFAWARLLAALAFVFAALLPRIFSYSRVESCSYSRVVVSVGVADENQPLLEEVAQHCLEEVVKRRLEEVMQPRLEEVPLLSRRWG